MKSTMFKAALACGTALFLTGAPMTAGAQQQPTLVITGGTLIDGNGGAPIQNATVIVTGNRITQVGRNLRAPAGAQAVDAWAGVSVDTVALIADTAVISKAPYRMLAAGCAAPGASLGAMSSAWCNASGGAASSPARHSGFVLLVRMWSSQRPFSSR